MTHPLNYVPALLTGCLSHGISIFGLCVASYPKYCNYFYAEQSCFAFTSLDSRAYIKYWNFPTLAKAVDHKKQQKQQQQNTIAFKDFSVYEKKHMYRGNNFVKKC